MLLEADDIVNRTPDSLSMMTYIALLRQRAAERVKPMPPLPPPKSVDVQRAVTSVVDVVVSSSSSTTTTTAAAAVAAAANAPSPALPVSVTSAAVAPATSLSADQIELERVRAQLVQLSDELTTMRTALSAAHEARDVACRAAAAEARETARQAHDVERERLQVLICFDYIHIYVHKNIYSNEIKLECIDFNAK